MLIYWELMRGVTVLTNTQPNCTLGAFPHTQISPHVTPSILASHTANDCTVFECRSADLIWGVGRVGGAGGLQFIINI